jgi:hypothetical protein
MSTYIELSGSTFDDEKNMIIDIVNHWNRGSHLDTDILYNFYMG